MTAVKSVHHINFIFADLDAAVGRFERLLGIGPFEYEALPARGVRTARVCLGETWIVLVSPTSTEGIPARYLREHGEGFFLISFGVDDIGATMENLVKQGTSFSASDPREGVADWLVADITGEQSPSVYMQLAQASS